MKKYTLLLFILISPIVLLGQNHIKLKGVEDIDKRIIDKIITEYTTPKKLKSTFDKEIAINMFSVVHKNYDTGDIIEGAKGRARFVTKNIVTQEIRTTLSLLTPFSREIDEEFILVNVQETKVPKGYDPYIKKLVLFFDENSNLLEIQGLDQQSEIVWGDARAKSATVFLLSKAI